MEVVNYHTQRFAGAPPELDELLQVLEFELPQADHAQAVMPMAPRSGGSADKSWRRNVEAHRRHANKSSDGRLEELSVRKAAHVQRCATNNSGSAALKRSQV
jgi:hypothetical protein